MMEALAPHFLGSVIDWVRVTWQYHNSVLAAPIGLAGHSWGAQVCANVTTLGRFTIGGITCVAGSWDQQSALDNLAAAGLPTLIVSGTADPQANPTNQPFQLLPTPKYQAALLSVGHWDYFGATPTIFTCPTPTPPTCPAAAQLTSELMLGFFAKHLRGIRLVPPSLMLDHFNRPAWGHVFVVNSGCAMRVRWSDVVGGAPISGQTTFGTWPSTVRLQW
jgi:hypothetical protein